MDQKDSNTHTRKLASAEELRDKKSGKSGSGKGGKKMWISLISLVIVLAAAVGIFYLSGVIKPEEEPTVAATLPPSTTVKVVNREKKDVAGVTVHISGEQPYTVLSNAKEVVSGDKVSYSYTYEIEGRPTFQLDQSLASTIIGYAANMTATDQIAEGVTDFTPYGLDKPSVVVTMSYRDGTKAVWNFGSKVPTGTGYYICKEGTSTVFVLYSTAYAAFTHSLNDLYVLNMPMVFQDYSAIRNLVIEQKGKDTIELRYLDETETTLTISAIKLVQPIDYDAHGDRSVEILTGCASLGIIGYAGEISELPDAGLEEPRAKIIAKDAEGNTLTYIVGNFADATTVYVQIDDSDTVYLADAATLTFLDNATVNYLVDQFVNLVNIKMVDTLKVTTADNEYEMSIAREPELDENGVQATDRNGQPKTIDTYFFDGVETTEGLFKDLYQIIIGTMVSKIHDDYDYLADTAVKVSYSLNTEPYEFTVEYLEYDESYYAVRRNDLTLFLIKKDKVDNLLTQMESFRNGTFVGD